MAIGSGILIGRKEIVESKLLNQLSFIAYFFKGSETKFVLVGFPSVCGIILQRYCNWGEAISPLPKVK